MKHIPGLVLLAAIAWIHLKDVPTKLTETPYMGWGYILLVAGCAAAGAWLLTHHTRAGYLLGSLISLGAIAGYTLTRSIGLPLAMDDIGNWLEPAGVLSLIAEFAFLGLSGWMLSRPSSEDQPLLPLGKTSTG